MPKKESLVPSVPEEALEKVVKPEKVNHLQGGLYRSMTPEKRNALSGIISAGLNDHIQSEGRPPCKKGNLEDIQQRTAEFIKNRVEEGRLPTVEGWAVALGIGRQTLYDWLNDTRDKEVYGFLRRVKDVFSDMHSSAAMGGITNPVSWIFYSKNMFGFADKTELVVTPNKSDPLGEEVDQKALEDKYADVVVEENLDPDFVPGE